MLTQEPNLAVGRIAADGALSITLSGAWTLRSGFPSAGPIAREIATRRPRSLVFEFSRELATAIRAATEQRSG